MNKSLLIVGGIIVLVAVVAGVYFFLSPKTSTPIQVANTEKTITAETKSENTAPKKSLRDLLTLTTNQECSFTDDQGNSGTLYGAGGKVRGDFSATVNGAVTQSHMFSDSTNMYFWVDGQTMGFKGSMDAMTNAGAQSGNKSVDVNKQVDYECKPWTVDTDTLAVPEGITFTDFGVMMPQGSGTNEAGQSALPDVNSIQCASCDNLPVDAQEQCKQALGC